MKIKLAHYVTSSYRWVSVVVLDGKYDKVGRLGVGSGGGVVFFQQSQSV